MIRANGQFMAFKESPQEECGVFGIYKNGADLNVTEETYMALYALQHRGQESAGIAVNDEGEFRCAKDIGVVPEALPEKALRALGDGKIAIGHVCYCASETIVRAAAQPLVMRYIKGSLAIAHNGAITNLNELHQSLEQGGAIFQSNSNAELIAYVVASQRIGTASIEEAVLSAVKQLKGAFSMVLSSPSKLIGVRDPNGFRPLCIGKLGESYVLSSESCAFDSLGAQFIRDVLPGEVVVIDEDGLHSYKENCTGKSSVCMFEYVYIARPDSVIDGVSVHEARKRAGEFLAEEYPVEADLVCGVPDSGVSAALGYAERSGIPYGVALIKNKYIGRSFAGHRDALKEQLAQVKINVLKAAVEGKRIVIIDDSIVKGTTCAHIVRLLKEAGAKEVHMRISSPPFLNQCYYGTDIKSEDDLIARKMTAEEICREIGADSLGYLSVGHLKQIAQEANVGFCDACFTGDYPAEIPSSKYEDKFAKKIEAVK